MSLVIAQQAYVSKTKLRRGEDAYAHNKFNQAASDALKSNRDIPDVRQREYACSSSMQPYLTTL